MRASSTSVYGPYNRESVQFPVWSHEAAVTRGPDGEYVAFFSYNKNPGPTRPVCDKCTDGSTPESCKNHVVPMIENTDPSYMSWAPNATGPWSEPVLILGPSVVRTMTPMDTNLAGVIKKDGSLIGMWRDHHPTGR